MGQFTKIIKEIDKVIEQLELIKSKVDRLREVVKYSPNRQPTPKLTSDIYYCRICGKKCIDYYPDLNPFNIKIWCDDCSNKLNRERRR